MLIRFSKAFAAAYFCLTVPSRFNIKAYSLFSWLIIQLVCFAQIGLAESSKIEGIYLGGISKHMAGVIDAYLNGSGTSIPDSGCGYFWSCGGWCGQNSILNGRCYYQSGRCNLEILVDPGRDGPLSHWPVECGCNTSASMEIPCATQINGSPQY